MKIYTKTGDSGETSLFGGIRVKKTDVRIQVIGSIDEINSWFGLIKIKSDNAQTRRLLEREQSNLFRLGSYLAMKNDNSRKSKFVISVDNIKKLEEEIDQWTKELPELKNFILPGGSPEASYVFIARGVCRRAERELVSLLNKEKLPREILMYVNRLSDWLFTLGRHLNKSAGMKETLWKGANS
jgi:cob(I)alamin adenosyltransferase